MTLLRFFVQAGPGRTAGPLSDDDLRDAIREGRYGADVRARCGVAPLWLPACAWAALGLTAPPNPLPPKPGDEERAVSPDLLLAPAEVLDTVRFAVAEHGQSFGPYPGKVLRDGFEGGKYRTAQVAPVGTEDWVAARRLFDRTLTDGARATQAHSAPDLKSVRCPTCRELILESAEVCPECDEPVAPASVASTRGSIPDDPEGASWWRMHWRPVVTFTAIMSLILSGVTLRFLAPGRFTVEPPQTATALGVVPPPVVCDEPCWNGEACVEGACVWQKPNGVGHVEARPGVAGPFELKEDVTDALLLDQERFAVGLMAGVELHSTRTGQTLGLISEAIQTRKLVRTESAVYAVGPQHIAVLDLPSLRLLKTLELGGIASDVTLGANGRRALVSLPGAHAVAILSTELHVELDRIRFGDDSIGPVGMDDTGRRALTTTGSIPLFGLDNAQTGGAIYAFDPGRLATDQDRVRASLQGNPVNVMMSPDGKSYVALRQANKLVPLEWQASGSVRQGTPIDVCDQPEQIELVRAGRRALVRCNRGRALEVLDLRDGRLVRHIPFNAPASDMVITPDGKQAVVALPGSTDGAIALVDLDTFQVELVPLTEPPSKVRISPLGDAVLALSSRSKVAWVIR